MEYVILPLSDDARQMFTLDMVIDGEPLQARVEIRYFPAPDKWMVSIWDHSSGEQLVTMLPLLCSFGVVNDLLLPFRHLRSGRGLGSLLCLRGTEEPTTPDPTGENLIMFQLLWGDSL